MIKYKDLDLLLEEVGETENKDSLVLEGEEIIDGAAFILRQTFINSFGNGSTWSDCHLKNALSTSGNN